MLGLVACLAGMALGSQLNSVSPQTGGNDTLLRAVGAAAIGGVSLFGGKGKLIYPVVGGLVVATIDNGLGLMGKVGPIDFTSPARSSSSRASCCCSRHPSTRSPASAPARPSDACTGCAGSAGAPGFYHPGRWIAGRIVSRRRWSPAWSRSSSAPRSPPR